MANRLEIVYNIKELMKDHTDDTLMSDRHILFLFKTYRAMFLRQLYSDRAKGLDDSAIQSLCLDMEPADRGVCGINTDCYINRSKKRLPNLLSLRGRAALKSVGPAIVGSPNFDIIDARDAAICMADPYATNSVFVDDGYLYVVGPTPAVKLMKCMRVQGVFDDPEALEEFSNCCNCSATEAPCVTDETEYPVPGHMIPQINDAVMKEFLQSLNVTAFRDTDNDSAPSSIEDKRGRNVR